MYFKSKIERWYKLNSELKFNKKLTEEQISELTKEKDAIWNELYGNDYHMVIKPSGYEKWEKMYLTYSDLRDEMVIKDVMTGKEWDVTNKLQGYVLLVDPSNVENMKGYSLGDFNKTRFVEVV